MRQVLRLRGDAGMALPMVIGVMLLVGALSAALLTTVQADTGLSRRDQDRKAAYAAAEAGLNNYLFRLADDPEVWSHCTLISGAPFVSNPKTGATEARSWRSVPGSQAEYTVELLPKPGQTQCDPTSSATAAATIFDQGILRIRATGRMRGQKRSIVAHLRRKQFLDYVWFTNYETQDPIWYTLQSNGAATTPDLVTWANAHCHYYRDGRETQADYAGTYGRPVQNLTTGCTEIQFISRDTISGPFHTNDSILICNGASLGGGPGSQVELNPPAIAPDPNASNPGWRLCGGGSPNWGGSTVTTKPQILTLPPTNATLLNDVQPGYVFTGGQHIVLHANNFDIHNDSNAALDQIGKAYPTNGLIYVQNGTCGTGYLAYDPYYSTSPAPGCADVFVNGTYGHSLTIASQKDIVVNEDITRSGDVLLGLIANEFVRVEHRVTPAVSSNCTNATPVHDDLRIEAAILSLAHSFAVDKYYCGATMGTLHVFGSITQNYRGTVGQSSGGVPSHGYIKDYQYDPRLAYRSPPHFLDPVSAGWRLLTDNEQIPAT